MTSTTETFDRQFFTAAAVYGDYTVEQLQQEKARLEKAADELSAVAKLEPKGSEKRRAMQVKFCKKMDMLGDVEDELRRRSERS
jgi:hypothetical protein